MAASDERLQRSMSARVHDMAHAMLQCTRKLEVVFVGRVVSQDSLTSSPKRKVGRGHLLGEVATIRAPSTTTFPRLQHARSRYRHCKYFDCSQRRSHTRERVLYSSLLLLLKIWRSLHCPISLSYLQRMLQLTITKQKRERHTMINF